MCFDSCTNLSFVIFRSRIKGVLCCWKGKWIDIPLDFIWISNKWLLREIDSRHLAFDIQVSIENIYPDLVLKQRYLYIPFPFFGFMSFLSPSKKPSLSIEVYFIGFTYDFCWYLSFRKENNAWMLFIVHCQIMKIELLGILLNQQCIDLVIFK
jgi:hypothetical protein